MLEIPEELKSFVEEVQQGTINIKKTINKETMREVFEEWRTEDSVAQSETFFKLADIQTVQYYEMMNNFRNSYFVIIKYKESYFRFESNCENPAQLLYKFLRKNII